MTTPKYFLYICNMKEVALVVAMPNLQFRLYNRPHQKQYLLMMSSDYERFDWREAITGLLHKG